MPDSYYTSDRQNPVMKTVMNNHYINALATALLLCLHTAAHADDIYSWVDDNGSTNYSDQPLGGSQSQTINSEPRSAVNYYQSQRPTMSVLEVVEEQQPVFAVEPINKLKQQQWDEDECQKIYALDCDAVYRWREHAIEACGRDKRCEDEDFLARKYKPLTLAEKHRLTLRSSARHHRQDREIRQFLMRKYTPYCEQQAAQYCQSKYSAAQCREITSACEDSRSLSQLLAQYNLSPHEKQAIIKKAKTLVTLQQEQDINEAISALIDLIKLQAMLL